MQNEKQLILTVNKEENFLSQIGAVSAAEILVKLFVKRNIVLCLDTEHSVTSVGLVDVINVMETVSTELLQD
jgi:hypothetical protein